MPTLQDSSGPPRVQSAAARKKKRDPTGQRLRWVIGALQGVKPRKQAEFAVLVVLADHANHTTGICWPSLSSIADESRVSRRYVPKVIRSLCSKGLVARAGSTLSRAPSNRYKLTGAPTWGGDGSTTSASISTGSPEIPSRVSDELIEELTRKFQGRLEDVPGVIDDARRYEYFPKVKNVEGYLRKWLQKEVGYENERRAGSSGSLNPSKRPEINTDHTKGFHDV